MVHIKRNDISAAIKDFKKSVELFPIFVEGHEAIKQTRFEHVNYSLDYEAKDKSYIADMLKKMK